MQINISQNLCLCVNNVWTLIMVYIPWLEKIVAVMKASLQHGVGDCIKRPYGLVAVLWWVVLLTRNVDMRNGNGSPALHWHSSHYMLAFLNWCNEVSIGGGDFIKRSYGLVAVLRWVVPLTRNVDMRNGSGSPELHCNWHSSHYNILAFLM